MEKQKQSLTFFGDAKDARENYFCDRDYQDFLTNCQILIQNKYLTGEILDDNIYNISILNKTFIEFEQNFGWTWMSQL